MDKIDLNSSVRDYLPEEQDISLLAYFTRPDIVLQLMKLDSSLLRTRLLEATDSEIRNIWFSLHPSIPLSNTPEKHYVKAPFHLKLSSPITPVEYLALTINRRIKGLKARMEALQELPGTHAVKYQDITSRIQENRRILEILGIHLQSEE